MKTKKIVAVQFDPEYQTSPFYWDESLPDNVAVLGNNRMDEHIPERCEKALAALRNNSFWDDLENPERAGYADAAGVLGDWLPRENGAAYNADECRALAERLLHGDLDDDAAALAALMSLFEGKPWKSRTIRGTCQSDWNEIAYPAGEWPDEALDAFECEYWNTGNEWDVYKVDAAALEKIDLEDVTRDELEEACEMPCSTYTHEWDNEKIKIEIAATFGAAPEDVVLMKFGGYVKTPRYTLA